MKINYQLFIQLILNIVLIPTILLAGNNEFTSAKIAFEKQHYQEAIRLYEHLISEKKPISDTDYYFYIQSLIANNNANIAINKITYFQKQFPKSSWLYKAKAQVEIEHKNPKIAIENLQKCIIINPKDFEAHFLLGMQNLQLQYDVPAIMCFAICLLTDTNHIYSQQCINNIYKIENAATNKKEGTNTSEVALKHANESGNHFIEVEMYYKLNAALDHQQNGANSNEIDRLTNNLITINDGFVDNYEQNKNIDFYWKHYVPFFMDLHNKNYESAFIWDVHQFERNYHLAFETWKKQNEIVWNNYLAWKQHYL